MALVQDLETNCENNTGLLQRNKERVEKHEWNKEGMVIPITGFSWIVVLKYPPIIVRFWDLIRIILIC